MTAGGEDPSYYCAGVGVPTEEATAFMLALEEYRRVNRRRYPTSSEVLAVAVALGYRRVAEPTELPRYRGRKEG